MSAGYIIVSNHHYGITFSAEFPTLSADLPDGEMPDQSESEGPNPWTAEIIVPANCSRRAELGDIAFGNNCLALSQRSTPKSFLDFPVIDVCFVKFVPEVPKGFEWIRETDCGLIADRALHSGAERYWLGFPPVIDSIRATNKNGATSTSMDVFRAFMSRGLDGVKFAVDADVGEWHVRFPAPGDQFLLVSWELWDHWQHVGATGILDAFVVPDRKYLVRGSVKNVDLPADIEACDN